MEAGKNPGIMTPQWSENGQDKISQDEFEGIQA